MNDRIGRPRERTYADGTSETFEYDGPRLLQMKDRQDRVLNYEHNANGQLFRIRNTTELIEELEYHPSGYLAKWRTRDAELSYDDYDLEGRPRRTKQKRYADHSGFGAKSVLDEYTQEHEWNVQSGRRGRCRRRLRSPHRTGRHAWRSRTTRRATSTRSRAR